MNKAWAILWFVVLATVVLVAIANIISPYLGIIAGIVAIIFLVWLAVKAERFVSNRRHHY